MTGSLERRGHSTAVDVWVVPTAEATDDQVTPLSALLTTDELKRGARFVRAVDRRAFVVARALVRTTLSRYGPTPPRDWRFVTNEYGCPFVDAGQAGAPPLCFNLSHTDGLVAMAVSRGYRVGVDVERTDRPVLEQIPERYFAPDEVRDLRALPATEQPRAFFDYWTLKESYIKARGMGLALPLDRFSFSLGGTAGATIRFAPGFGDLDSRWQFWLASPTPVHRLALAIERRLADLPVRLRPRTIDALLR